MSCSRGTPEGTIRRQPAGGKPPPLARLREDKVRTIVDDVMEKLPELFNMRELMAKVEERTPYVIVCFQVLNRENMEERSFSFQSHG